MTGTFIFYLNSILFGVGLAMDAFSISLANGLNEPKMAPKRVLLIAGVFGGFQFVMPMIGWVLLHTVTSFFNSIQWVIPYIALAILLFIGIKMLVEAIKNKDDDDVKPAVSFGALLIQGIATSIDALSVGFTIAYYTWFEALIESLIIGIVTFAICVAGLFIGKAFGMRFKKASAILGGVILILIGIEIFITGVFF
ncbi:MAG: manganese efflux pump [Parasporobacterium sp.]|nr:manganese efflux pump [Parasporobacterium sp.]